MKRTIIIIALLVLLTSIPIITEANDSIQVNLENPILQMQEVKIPWYKNMNYTFGYNRGLCLRGKSLGGSSNVGLPTKIFVDLVYWLNSIEAGVRIPFNNRMIEAGLGYGWGNIISGSFEVSFPDTLINSTLTNWANLDFKNIKKLYMYTGYLISKSIYMGSELNYCQGYGTECYSNHFHIYNVRRDLIGVGGYIKLNSTITLNKNFKINPYLIFKIAGSYEIHSTSPYSGLWDKKLTVWYTGIYGGFNFSIGGKR